MCIYIHTLYVYVYIYIYIYTYIHICIVTQLCCHTRRDANGFHWPLKRPSSKKSTSDGKRIDIYIYIYIYIYVCVYIYIYIYIYVCAVSRVMVERCSARAPAAKLALRGWRAASRRGGWPLGDDASRERGPANTRMHAKYACVHRSKLVSTWRGSHTDRRAVQAEHATRRYNQCDNRCERAVCVCVHARPILYNVDVCMRTHALMPTGDVFRCVSRCL